MSSLNLGSSISCRGNRTKTRQTCVCLLQTASSLPFGALQAAFGLTALLLLALARPRPRVRTPALALGGTLLGFAWPRWRRTCCRPTVAAT
jgi:hypothetical protein